jgi:hypothetical protein
MNKPLPSFARLQEMAQQDPDALERLRQQHVKAAIEAAPEDYRKRLEGLQFQIDGQRRLAKSPMASCLTISKMMHDHLHQLKAVIEGQDSSEQVELEEAKVLSFPQQA